MLWLKTFSVGNDAELYFYWKTVNLPHKYVIFGPHKAIGESLTITISMLSESYFRFLGKTLTTPCVG